MEGVSEWWCEWILFESSPHVVSAWRQRAPPRTHRLRYAWRGARGSSVPQQACERSVVFDAEAVALDAAGAISHENYPGWLVVGDFVALQAWMSVVVFAVRGCIRMVRMMDLST